eukprot:TRINITY_DN9434_c0_g1_i1.p1 TRINITY_DN9434_c0_g1~~TRINITY_DN9434_c0_g1_i1.p1  ORF type:complete len:403 (-),score=130.79 TRINITY_DN9434_c0_g1_i1:170-1378(-)
MALRGIKVLEIAGLAPVPFCGMLLADFGADVIRVDRVVPMSTDQLSRGKRSIAINLKSEEGVELLKEMCKKVDVLIEPFRPGVLERLGLDPEMLIKINPRLIVARLTGFGQTGTLSQSAGHDINYISINGVLGAIKRKDENPLFPLNIGADFAGGGIACATGILLALIERSRSGKGQIIDSAMSEGSNYLNSFYHYGKNFLFRNPIGENMLDTGAHFYEVYETKDNKFMAVGAIEPQFYKLLIKGLGLENEEIPDQLDESKWPEMKERFKQIFLSKTRSEWEDIFSPNGPLRDSCVTPVLHPNEVLSYPHNQDRNLMFKDDDNNVIPSPSPILSRTPAIPTKASSFLIPGTHTTEILLEMNFSKSTIQKLSNSKTINKINLDKYNNNNLSPSNTSNSLKSRL